MSDLMPGFMQFTTRPAYGLFLRFFGLGWIAAGLVLAERDRRIAGFTPVVCLLGGITAFLGVICNELA